MFKLTTSSELQNKPVVTTIQKYSNDNNYELR